MSEKLHIFRLRVQKHFRVLLQANVRQLARAPGSIDCQKIEKDRDTLTSLMSQVKQEQQNAGVFDKNETLFNQNEDLGAWDDIIYEPVISEKAVQSSAPAASSSSTTRPAASSSSTTRPNSESIGPLPIEEQLLSLPSNGNIDSTHRDLERTHRISLAEHHLNQIRNLIAEKSFQFSHLIRVAPRKAVATRSRAAVTKLNQEIALHCRMYTRCRSRIVVLGADPSTLSRLQILSLNDIRASTAIVNPNEPGSSSIKLSWIWQSAGGHRFGLAGADTGADTGADPDAGNRVLECERIIYDIGCKYLL